MALAVDSTDLFPRLVTASRSGRYVAIRQREGIHVVDALGTSPRHSLGGAAVEDFDIVGNELWLVVAGQLQRYRLEGAKKLGTLTLGGESRGRLTSAPRHENTASVLWGKTTLLTVRASSEVSSEQVPALESCEFALPLGGSRILALTASDAQLHDTVKGPISQFRIPGEGAVRTATTLMGGRAFAILREHTLHVVRATGEAIHRIAVPGLSRITFAETRGLALVLTRENHVLAIDLRFGKQLADEEAPLTVSDLAIDADAKYIALAGFHPGDDKLAVLYMSYAELFGGRGTSASGEVDAVADPASTADALEAPAGDWAQPAEATTAAESQQPQPEEDVLRNWQIPDIPLQGLGRTYAEPARDDIDTDEAYETHHEHLHDLLDLVVAKVMRAISDSWDSGRLSFPSQDTRPFEREVYALSGQRLSSAPEEVASSEARVLHLTSAIARRAQASLASGLQLPFVDVVREFGLSGIAAQALLVVAAPSLHGEVARLYGVLSNDENRPICDRYLVEMILAGENNQHRDAVARELAEDAPLLRYGLVRALPAPEDQFLFAPLCVDPILVSRLRGSPNEITTGDVASVRIADKTLAELAVPKAVLRDAILETSAPKQDGAPVRLVVRGRPGSGRRTFMASLAARAGKTLSVIEAERLPRGGRQFAERLRAEMRRAALRGAIPCVSGLEVLSGENAEGIEHVIEVFRTFPGPVMVRTSPEAHPPLDPGYKSLLLPPLSENARHEFWEQTLKRYGLNAQAAESMAARFRIGPGTIERIVASVAQRRALDANLRDDVFKELDATARQHISARLGSVATHVTRLARWEQVALPDDVMDSIREFLGRIKYRRKVYDTWGFDKKMTTSRGLTALFHGPPGTGKSMVGGLIARELGLDLYRVDLARVTSKWIGETEKNLAEVFDAAEDGQAVILFDEADSLFAKRTEVKSSVDRYANLEVNYLLQRLDSFDGVAILTTNLEGSIDNAFKRRLTLRLAFPFPDEEMRVRLWQAHIPAEVPVAGDFDFSELAHRFPMSGGYIRNSSLRGAFLAAQESVPLSQTHLVRAIALEYREMGKLSSSGKLE